MIERRFIPEYTEDELSSLQERGLLWSVKHAYKNNPQYQASFKAAGLEPGDIRGLGDLSRLPFSTADDLRYGYPLPFLSVPQRKVVRVHASSGTTGKRKVLAYTARDVNIFSTQMARCYELAGLTREDRVQVAVGYGLWTAGAGFQLGCELFGAMSIPVGAGNLEIHLQMLADMGTTCLGSTASMALLMGEEVQRGGLADKISLKKVIFGAEGHSPKMRKAFEEHLGVTQSYNIGGMTEMYGPGTSLECDLRTGLHYWADFFIIEIIDPETLKPVAPGEIGEMVVTTLCKEASPLIRYRTRDITRLMPGACPCGCSMPRHDHLLGRSDDMFIFRGVNIYPGQIADAFHHFPELGSEYHIDLSRHEAKDLMDIQVERSPDATAGNDDDLAKRLAKTLHSKLLISCTVKIADPGTLPRSFGKSKRVTDTRLND